MVRANALSLFQHDFRGVRKIVEKHLLHGMREGFIFDRHVQLPVTHPACQIEIA
jgi:hypothetical protein